ncbi:ribonuclease H-like domain-containing protein [Tanacetum coccineum]
MCDKKNSLLFTDTECVVLSSDFKLLDESQVLLRVPGKDSMTPQQNGVAEKKNRTLIKAVRTMLADSKLPTTFWAEAVNTACYVQNRVLVIKPHNKTPYELFYGRTPSLSFMRPFGYPVTILNTLDHLGKFDGKADEGFFVRYTVNSKAFRVFNSRTRIVEENLHITFLENKPNIARSGPEWLFDIDTLTKSMNYKPVVAGNQSNGSAGTKACDNADKARAETIPGKDYILLPFLTQDPLFSSSSKDSTNAGFKPSGEEEKNLMKKVSRDKSDAVTIESLAIKYPIFDWKTHILAEDKMYYQIIRDDGSAKFYKIFSAMLDDFDRQYMLDLYRLVKERFETTSPEGYDRLLWGDLITLFEPSEEDEIWKAQQDYTFISWRLYELCEVHLLLMDTGITIHMMVEKKYPLTQKMLSRMLSGKLEVDHECEMAYKLLRFTKS